MSAMLGTEMMRRLALIRPVPGCFFYPQRQWMAEYRTVVGVSEFEHQRLLEEGYYRQGQLFYSPVCLQCRECIPLRVDVTSFRASKSQRRLWRENRGRIRLEVAKPSFSDAKFALFRRYQSRRWNMVIDDPDEFRLHMIEDWGGAWEFTYWLDERLVGLGVVDEMPESANSRYFVYDGDRRLGLGIYSLLCELDWCRHLHKQHLYLGMYLTRVPGMDYKAGFRPFELRLSQGWQKFPDVATARALLTSLR